PVVATAGFLAFLVYASWAGGEASAVGRDRFVLWVLSLSIQVFAVVAFLHYLAMVVILAFGWRQASGDMRRSAGWLLGAATATAIPIGYTVTLAWADPAEFAFGGARLPMLIAAVLFATGYVIGLGPSKLTTLEAAAGRGSKYLLASGGLAAAFVLAVGLLLFAQGRFDRAAASGGLVPAATIATLLVVAVLLWLRDRAQDAVDRRFFRDKYQLDVTLRGVNSAVVDESDPQTLTRQMLASCRNALGVDYAALYRVDDGGDDGRQFSLVAVDGEGDGGRPPVIAADGGLVRALAEGGVRRSVAASATRHPSAQRVLRAVDASVLYPLPGQSRVGGFLALGRTAKDVPLSAEDLTLLDAVTHVLAAATGLHERFEVELRRRADTIESLERQLTGLRSELAGTYAADAEPERGDADAAERVVGGGHAIRAVLASARKVADSKTTVLIRGESGTGKELLAESIHENSGRRGGPLVKVNCAALAPGVLESELFGHVKGAFTGADRDKPGRFRAAEGGTLFLDEVGDIPAETQVKLLRALQERCVEPVGSHESVDVDVRVVAATNRDLEEMIAAGTFREDLFYRLNVVTLTLPPLRERVEDLEELAIAFLHRSARESGRAVVGFGDGVLASLARYDWPGNIRELRNVVERAVVLADGSLVETADLPADFSALSGRPRRRRVRSEQPPPRPVTSRPSLPPPADRPENASPREDAGRAIGDRDQLARVLAECGGNKAAAARRLGVARSTLFSQLKKHGIG
ncbi:MAG: sigma 54-interacting transcriptional regulator, partial [Planctomycetota bacterium]